MTKLDLTEAQREALRVAGRLSKMPVSERVARYDEVKALKETLSLRGVAAVMTERGVPMSGERVRQLLKAGPPALNGEEPLSERDERIKDLRERITRWNDRGTEKALQRADVYRAQLDALLATPEGQPV